MKQLYFIFVVVLCMATGCGSKKEELEGQVAVYNVDVDANSDLAMQYRVMSVPSLLLFKDGQVAGQTVGYQSADEIKAFIANN